MKTTVIQPRFSDTDALGHISNTTFPVWFEASRTELFKIFHPTMDTKTWPLIIARIAIDFLAQTYWQDEVIVKTYIEKIGTSSCHIIHEAWQGSTQVANGLAVMIYFDYTNNQAKPIPDNIREQLAVHIKTKEGPI